MVESDTKGVLCVLKCDNSVRVRQFWTLWDVNIGRDLQKSTNHQLHNDKGL